jgi:hypothetical protein
MVAYKVKGNGSRDGELDNFVNVPPSSDDNELYCNFRFSFLFRKLAYKAGEG